MVFKVGDIVKPLPTAKSEGRYILTVLGMLDKLEVINVSRDNSLIEVKGINGCSLKLAVNDTDRETTQFHLENGTSMVVEAIYFEPYSKLRAWIMRCK